jgi:hypothetical protein
MALLPCPLLPIQEVRQAQSIRNGIEENWIWENQIIAPISPHVLGKRRIFSLRIAECMDRDTCDGCARLTSVGGNIAWLFDLTTSEGNPVYDPELPVWVFCQRVIDVYRLNPLT